MQWHQISNLKFLLGIRGTSGKRCPFILLTVLSPNECNAIIVLALQTSHSFFLKRMGFKIVLIPCQVTDHHRNQASSMSGLSTMLPKFWEMVSGALGSIFNSHIPTHPMSPKPFQSPAWASLRPQPLAH